MLRSGREYRYLRDLKGVVHQPHFNLVSGELISSPGYDEKTAIYGDFDPGRFALGPATREAADAALGNLRYLFREFHFSSDADLSAALCAVFTSVVRASLPLAPAFNFTASTSGTGKSLLMSTVARFGGLAAILYVSYPTRAEEASKAMLSNLLVSPQAIAFDDMQHDWYPHGPVNRMLTSTSFSDRRLGGNETATVPTNVLVLGTGNNIGPSGDMSRRVITCRLELPTATPGEMRYVGRPEEEILARREHYVGCVLTIMRAYRAAGCPRGAVPQVPSYEGPWSDYCRHPLIWLGLPDPATSLFAQLKDDPDREVLGELLEALWMQFGGKGVPGVLHVGSRPPDHQYYQRIDIK